MEMQSKTRVELRLKVKILFKMSNWEKDSGWSRKKNRLITLGHHTGGKGGGGAYTWTNFLKTL